MTVLAIVIPILVIAAAVLFVVAARRGDARRGAGALSRETVKRDRSALDSAAEPQQVTGREVERAAQEQRSAALVPAGAAPPAPYVPPADPDTIGVTRRQFFNRSAVALMTVGLTGFGLAVLAFLWPRVTGGFGARITVGPLDDVRGRIRENSGFLYLPEGRAWLTEFPPDGIPKAEAVYPGPVMSGITAGINALYQKCPHLGCRVPECVSSQWFECPCHGSQYDRAGEKKAGPAPRGMDRFGVSITGGQVVVDTGTVFPGPPIGTNTTGQEAEGPHCITAGGDH
jgi:cytochrome b6-f complex iron-sulfur subunit